MGDFRPSKTLFGIRGLLLCVSFLAFDVESLPRDYFIERDHRLLDEEFIEVPRL